MKIPSWHWCKLFLSSGMFSVNGLLLRAAVLAAAYSVAQAAGWREYTSILCGTAPSSDPKDLSAVVLGLTYVILHFGFILIVPVLLLAAGLLAVAHKLFTAKKGP